MKITKYNRIKDLEAIWRKLYDHNPRLTIFQSYEWNIAMEMKYRSISSMVINHLRAHWVVEYFLFEFDNWDDAVIAPVISSQKNKIIEIFGYHEMSDYLSFIFTDKVSILNIREALLYLKKEFFSYEINIDRINETNTLMIEALNEISNYKQEKKCVYIPVVNDIMGSIKSDPRRYAKQGYKRMEQDNIVAQLKISHDQISKKKYSELYDHYLNRRRIKFNLSSIQCIKDQSLQLFYRIFGSEDLIKYFLKVHKEPIYLFQYKVGEKLGSYMLGVVYHGYISVLRISIDDELFDYRPGILMIIEAVTKISKDFADIKYLDFSRGDESYKLNYGGVLHYNYLYTL